MKINLMDITQAQLMKLCDENIIEDMIICDDCQLLATCRAVHGTRNIIRKIKEVKRFVPLLNVEVEV